MTTPSDRRTRWNSTIRTNPDAPKLKRVPIKKRRTVKRFAKLRDPAFCRWVRRCPCAAGGSARAAERLNAHFEAKGETPPQLTEAWLILFGVKDCSGPIECAHVKTRACGGADRGNALALCRTHHRQQHAKGILSFQALYRLDMAAIARSLDESYTDEEAAF